MTATERLLVLVNAPANGDRHSYDAAEMEQCAQRTFQTLERCGLHIQSRPEATRGHDAGGFQQAVSGDGRRALRPQLARMDGVVSAAGSANQDTGTVSGGGSAHPGPGVPMAALSGRSAAASLLADLTSTRVVARRRLCVVVYRRAERRRPKRHHHHRLHRQRVLALLRPRATQRRCRSAQPLRGQRRNLSQAAETAGP